MKVKIGDYLNYIGPYQIAGVLRYVGVSEDTCDNIGEKLAGTKLNALCEWVYRKRKRTIKIRIDEYDSWSAYHTMALIILPILKDCQKRGGAPWVQDEDVPEHLRTGDDTSNDKDWFPKWEYVIEEIIFAFEHVVDEDWEEKFHTGNCDFIFEPCEDLSYTEMKEGPNHTHEFDYEGWKLVDDKIANGLTLFGKYYRALWT